MKISEPIGTPGAPKETLEDLANVLERLPTSAKVLLITDIQGHRSHARYAVLFLHGSEGALSREAFGPRYGPEGILALDTLVRTLLERGINDFKECVVMPSDFGRLMQEPEGLEFERLISSANPTDPNLYLTTHMTDVLVSPVSSPLE